MQSQSQTGVAAAQIQASANDGNTGNRKSPLPEIKEERRIPIIKAGTIGMSMRRQPVTNIPTNKPTNSPTPTGNSVQTEYEDYMVYEKDLIYYWRDFASKLPKE
jgi:DNA polymerase-3 subunit gamma/tau